MPELPSTQWSLIRASAGGDSHAARAWEALVADYEKAIRAFFRRSPLRTDADDLTQAFVEASIAGGWWGRADEGKGSFRSFLFLLLRRFLARQLRDAPPRAEEIDVDAADHGRGIEHAYDVAFVLQLTERALAALRREYRERGRGELFEAVAPILADPPAHGRLQELAGELGLRPNTLTVEVRRLRQRLIRQLQAEVRELCADQAQFEAEMQSIRAVLAGSELSHLSRNRC